MKANIIMTDESELKEVYIFRNKELGDSIVSTKEEIELLLNFDSDKTIYFSGNYIQGGLIPKRIQEYEIIDDEKEDNGILIAFWDGESKGTGHMINLAKKHGLKVFVVKY